MSGNLLSNIEYVQIKDKFRPINIRTVKLDHPEELNIYRYEFVKRQRDGWGSEEVDK
jgi:hypothetical protein